MAASLNEAIKGACVRYLTAQAVAIPADLNTQILRAVQTYLAANGQAVPVDFAQSIIKASNFYTAVNNVSLNEAIEDASIKYLVDQSLVFTGDFNDDLFKALNNYISTGGPATSNAILREDGTYLLREDGFKILREA